MFVQTFELESDIRPNDENLIQAIKTPLDDILFFLVQIVVDRQLDKEVQEDLPALVVLVLGEHGQLALDILPFCHLFLDFLEQPLNIDETEVTGDFLVERVLTGLQNDILPKLLQIHRVDHLSVERFSIPVVELMVLDEYMPETA